MGRALEGRPPEVQCGSKQRFLTRADAKAAIKNRRGRGYDGKRIVAYRCPHCGWWHYGHAPEQTRDPLR